LRRNALIIGGNLAAVQAALDLAESGIAVTLVEPSPFLGNDEGGWRSTAQSLEAVKHPNITLMTDTRVLAIHGRKGDFQVEIERAPRYVALTKCTACGDCVEVCPITVPVDGGGRTAIFGGGDGAVPNVFAIDKRGVAPCKATCPGGIHVQGYVALIAQGRFKEALDLVREAVPFPGVLGRVCYHPCEDACRRGTEIDEPVSICALKRFVADYEVAQGGASPPDHQPAGAGAVPQGSGKVSIVGSGPAGLTVAYFLARRGIQCDVFEALPVAGGMLAVGIPDYRLPPEVLEREIAVIQARGVTIQLDHPVDDARWAELLGEYDAVFVGVGAHRARQLHIPGEELEGIIPGVQLLREVNLASILGGGGVPQVGAHVVVIGGGNTAIDSAMVARRLGAEQVTILYRRSRPEMLANPWEIQEAEAEGVQFDFLASPVRAIGRDGRVVALECLRNELGEPDQSGRRRPLPVEGSEFIIQCDTLLSAIGQATSCAFPGLELDRWGSIKVDPVTLQTSIPNVFAGGDAVIGPASVIESIGDGRRAVESILRHLQGEDLSQGRTAERVDISQIDYYTPDEPVVRARVQMPHIPLEKRTTFAEIASGLTEDQAIAEAQRCLSCGICSECLACVQVCEPAAIDHDQTATRSTLEASVVIWSDAAGAPLPVTRGNIYQLHGHDPLTASAVAAQAMADLAMYRQKRPLPPWVPRDGSPRIGVFVCECGERIAGVLDVGSLVEGSRGKPGVIHAQSLPFACQPEGADAIRQAMVEHGLNQVVLAACSCCSLDQVCESCTYQRVRCKSNLLSIPPELMSLPAEFVNIREQCAWVHRDDPARGSAKAARLIAAAIAKANLLPAGLGAPRRSGDLEGRVLVAGGGEAAQVCVNALRAQNFAVTHSPTVPLGVQGSLGRFTVAQNGVSVGASVVVLAPADEAELAHLSPRSGIFVCLPGQDAEMIGAAVAAKVGATLGSGRVVAVENIAHVNPARCRACGTCESVCEFAAITVSELGNRLCAQVDPLVCQGCGACAAHCPSSAIAAGYSTDQQIAAMLEAILGGG
jgi:NADPH-dependent glutamate synthase beta subunit-like oxidoreductase/Pyruvate/2-oxoacid:ferredoxin oxidoreductase delta subunit